MGPILGAIAAAAPFVGKAIDWATGRADQANSDKLQREFAQNGISWKVEDAKRAGIHPLYALGANTTSYQSSVGGSGYASEMGQDISRAIDSTRTADERLSATERTLQALQLERSGLENQLLAAQIAKLSNPTPPMAGSDYLVPGQTSSGLPVFPKDGLWLNPTGDQPANARPGVSLGGHPFEFFQDTPDAQTVEDRYGDIVQNAYGLYALGRDVVGNYPNSYGARSKAAYDAASAAWRRTIPPGGMIIHKRGPFRYWER